jgi:hypothetical protein
MIFFIMKLAHISLMVTLIVSLGLVLPVSAQICYNNCDQSLTPNTSQQNQEKATDKGGLMVGFYTDPATPTISNKTSLDLIFEDKDTRYPLSNVDYQVSILKGNNLIYQTPVYHSTQGTSKVQYQFTESGQYQVIIHITGMKSKPIPLETASFSLTVGSSTVPEFPIAMAVLIIGILVTLIITRIKWNQILTFSK